MTGNAFDFLQTWYHAHCDGDWEHMFGVEIGTLDNPGWMIKVDLAETELENAPFEQYERNIDSDEDWVSCKVKEKKFQAAGGPKNLEELLTIFKAFAEKYPEVLKR